MNWQQWVLIIFLALSVLDSILTIGKERKPLDSSTAAISVVINAIFIALVASI